MKRSTLGRNSLVVVVLAATISLTAEPSFGETTDCKASPGAAAPQGMHWYYRVDRTNNRHCWYLQSAGMQVRSRLSMTRSSASQVVTAERRSASLSSDSDAAAPSQVADPAPAETSLEPSVAVHAAMGFAARWLDLPASVDLQARESDRPRISYAAEQTAPVSKEPMAAPTWFVAADVKDTQPSAGVANFGSVFLASALGIILFGRVLKLTRRWYDCAVWPTLAPGELADGSEKGAVELRQILRRVDEAVPSPRSFAPVGGPVKEMLADRRAPKPDYLGDRTHSAVRRFHRGRAMV